MKDEYISVAQLAKCMGLSLTKIYHSVEYEDLPHVRIGKRLLFTKEMVDRMMAERNIETAHNKSPGDLYTVSDIADMVRTTSMTVHRWLKYYQYPPKVAAKFGNNSNKALYSLDTVLEMLFVNCLRKRGNDMGQIKAILTAKRKQCVSLWDSGQSPMFIIIPHMVGDLDISCWFTDTQESMIKGVNSAVCDGANTIQVIKLDSIIKDVIITAIDRGLPVGSSQEVGDV